MKIVGSSSPQSLPNEKAVVIVGIVSIVAVCCTGGIVAVGASILGLIYVHKDLLLYAENPSAYTESSKRNIQSGRILCIIGLALGLFVISIFLYEIITGSWWLLNKIVTIWNG